MAALLDRRLHFVTGKGGVGKTTVAAALALELATSGRRTLLIEMDTVARMPTLFGRGPGRDGPAALAQNLWAQCVDGRSALEEYLGLIMPVKRLLSGVFNSRIYQYFVAAAPGLKELMTVGKVWYEATREERGHRVWDAIVVDAPATGHGLQYLQMPQAARDTFGTGLVQREAAKVVSLLQDPATTAIHLVTLAEEMPVTETLETHARLVGQLAMPFGAVVVNRVHERRFDADVVARLRGAAGSDAALLGAVADRADEESGWATINAQGIAKLRAALPDAAFVMLPFLFVEEFERTALEVLMRRLGQQLGTGASA